jgi:tellurite resistance protein TehA-like permease
VPLTYEPTWWSIVFPLDMYAVAGMYLGRADDLLIVEWIGRAWLRGALTARTLVLLAMLHARFTTGTRGGTGRDAGSAPCRVRRQPMAIRVFQ